MPISLSNEMMRQIIMEHYSTPYFKHQPKDNSYQKVHMHSDNCIDDIDVFVKLEDDKIVDVCFDGVGCAIATSSTDIMCGLIKGKTKKEANYIIEQYFKMIGEQPFDDGVLDEALVFINTSKQAARIRCATIGWNAAKELIK